MISIKRQTVLLIGSAVLLHSESTVVLFQPKTTNSLELFVDKTGILSGKRHRFVFGAYEGRLEMDKSVEFTIRAGTISCRDTWVKSSDLPKIERVAKNDMLLADKHPLIRYTSTSIEALDKDQYRVHGTLQI